MLVTTKILIQLSTGTTLARDWRVVSVSEEDSRVIDVVTLFSRILEHVYDPLEPFVPIAADTASSIRAAV